jgi:FkbM family methyltransferase
MKSGRNNIYGLMYDFKIKDTFIVKRKNKKYLIAKNDSISKKIYIHGRYGDKKIKTAEKILRKQGFIFDFLINVGANIGTTIIQLSEFGFKNGLGIEPNPKAFRLLSRNISLNKLEQFKLLNIALSRRSGSVSMSNHENLGTNFVTSSSYANRIEIIEVESNTLDNIIELQKIPLKSSSTLLWMDVQGFEIEVLKGAQNFLQSGCPIVLEFWPYVMLKNSDVPNFMEIFEKYSGYYDLSDKKIELKSLNNLDTLFFRMRDFDVFTDILVL